MAVLKATAVLVWLGVLCLGVYGEDEENRGDRNQAWNYGMQDGKSGWAAHFPECGKKSQSPIDLKHDKAKHKEVLGKLNLTGFDTKKKVSWYLTNNGHSAKVAYESGNPMISGGGLVGIYKVAQFHFHWGSVKSKGSEHTFNGKQYPMEMHIVAHNVDYENVVSALGKKNGLAVLAVFVKETKNNDNDEEDEDDGNANDDTSNALEALVSKFKKIKEPGEQVTLGAFPLENLLPKNKKDYFRYTGSLTAPPCSGKVTWTVFRKPIRISSSQINEFRTQLKSFDADDLVDNFRFTQPLDGRTVIHNTHR